VRKIVKSGIEIVGIKSTRRFLKKKSSEYTSAAKDGIRQATFFMEGEVKASISGKRAENASVDTGRFLNSVVGKVSGLIGKIQSIVTYSKFLEFGTKFITARKHFRNSVARNRTKIKKYINDKLKGV